jgi:UDP-GlcNAc:undecaprenyl-phosphate GlcNAc-1-phosphate transferase
VYSLGLLAVSSFVLALALTPLVRNLARRRGLVDRPDQERRVHADAVPRLGGVAIVLAYLGAFAVLLAAPVQGGEVVRDSLPLIWRLLPAAVLVFGVGLLDDIRGLTPLQKLLGQVAAALAAVWAGVYLAGFGGLEFPVWIGAPLTLVWLVGCANAFNLIDGVDGLAAGVGLFATATVVFAALLGNNTALAIATVPLAGALAGFLRFNFNPATIFLGDSGSLLVGFLLGCYGLQWSQKAATALGMTAPLMAMSIPLLDTALAIARRFLRRQPVWQADLGHIHHRLLARGLTPRKVVLLLYGAAAFGASLSLLQSSFENRYSGLAILLFCAMAWVGVQHLGYVEFGVAGRMFIDGAFRRHLNSQLALQTFEQELAAARTAAECWRAVCEACRAFGFTEAEFRLNGDRFRATLLETNGNPTWQMQIPVEEGWLKLKRCFDAGGAPTVLAPFADSLHRGIESFNRRHGELVQKDTVGHR